MAAPAVKFTTAAKMTAPELLRYVESIFPEAVNGYSIDSLQLPRITVRRAAARSQERPGGTVAGPSMFALADCTFYMLTMAALGPEPLVVTTNCSIDFLRKPQLGADLLAHGQILKLGRTLCVGDVLIHSATEPDDRPVARASLTYSIPPWTNSE